MARGKFPYRLRLLFAILDHADILTYQMSWVNDARPPGEMVAALIMVAASRTGSMKGSSCGVGKAQTEALATLN